MIKFEQGVAEVCEDMQREGEKAYHVHCRYAIAAVTVKGEKVVPVVNRFQIIFRQLTA